MSQAMIVQTVRNQELCGDISARGATQLELDSRNEMINRGYCTFKLKEVEKRIFRFQLFALSLKNKREK